MPKFDYSVFRADVRREMSLKRIKNYRQLSDVSGTNYRTIKSFMSGQRDGKKTAFSIKNALDIKFNYGFEPKE